MKTVINDCSTDDSEGYVGKLGRHIVEISHFNFSEHNCRQVDNQHLYNYVNLSRNNSTMDITLAPTGVDVRYGEVCVYMMRAGNYIKPRRKETLSEYFKHKHNGLILFPAVTHEPSTGVTTIDFKEIMTDGMRRGIYDLYVVYLCDYFKVVRLNYIPEQHLVTPINATNVGTTKTEVNECDTEISNTCPTTDECIHTELVRQVTIRDVRMEVSKKEPKNINVCYID